MNKKIIAIVTLALVCGVIFFSLLPKGEERYVFSKDWLRKENIYVYGMPTLDYLRAVNAKGVTWSVYYSGLNDYDKEYLNSLHSNGFKVGSNLPTVQGSADFVGDNQSLLERASCRDLNGGTSYLSWVAETKVYFMCHNNPEWQEFLKKRIKEHIDGGADVIHIDEIEGTGGHLDIAGFCEYCMTGFRSYLANRYSAAELRDNFGIENIDSFNYRTYLLSHGATTVWEDPNRDLLNEYLRFQYSSRLAQLRELIQYAREYAGRDILFSGNTYGLLPVEQIYVPLLNFSVFEMSLEPLPEGKHFTTYLLGEAMSPSKPFVAFPDIFTLASLSQDDWWLWRHWLAEAYACGESFLLPYRAYTYGGGEFTLPAEKISAYTSFISAHSGYYANTSRLAKIAVLYSLKSTLYNWSAWENFKSIGRTLQEAHVQFEVVYVGDGELIDRSILLSDLQRYSIVIIPTGHNFDATVESLLNQYIDTGGHVIAPLTTPGLGDLLSQLTSTAADLGLETNASVNLGITVYKKGDSLILHFVNYDYDYNTHNFKPQNSIAITLTIPEGVNLTGKVLRLLSPDAGKETTLDYTVQGNKVTFTIPEVHEYLISSFE